MYHADREIRDKAIIKAILTMCDVITVAFADGEYPYMVPVNYGFEFDEHLCFYTHHAIEGYKNKLIEARPKVCVVAYKFVDKVPEGGDKLVHDYRSVMAFGEMSFIPRESEEYAKAWEVLCSCNSRRVPDAVFEADYQVRLGKIVCLAENVIGKAQYPIAKVEEVPFNM